MACGRHAHRRRVEQGGKVELCEKRRVSRPLDRVRQVRHPTETTRTNGHRGTPVAVLERRCRADPAPQQFSVLDEAELFDRIVEHQRPMLSL